MKSSKQNLRDAQLQQKQDKLLGPGHFFFPLKTTLSISAYREAEVFSLEQLFQYLRNWASRLRLSDLFIAIQGKFDGVSCSLHRDKDGNFTVFTEDGSDVTDKFPHLIKIAESTFPKTDYILIGEVEKWIKQGGKLVHQGREVVSGELHTKSPTQDSEYVWNLHDCVWFDGQDIHKQLYKQRWALIEEKFPIKQSLLSNIHPGFNLVPTPIVSGSTQVRRVINNLLRFDNLEGAMIKRWDGYKFELDGRTSDMVKFKKYAEAHCVVLDSRLIKGQKKTWQYKIGVEVLPSELEDVDESKLRVLPNSKTQFLEVGKTFNTGVAAEIGDIITVKFHTLFVHKDDAGKISLALYEPKVYENRTIANANESADTVTTLMKIGRDAQLIQMKDLDDFIPFELVKQTNIWEQYPEENLVHKFVMHYHWRGKSVHCDFRIEHVKNQYLLGYTLDNPMPGIVDAPVTTEAMAEKWAKDDRLWKFNAVTGEFKARQTRGGLKKATSIMVQLKEPEPIEWLTFEGVVERGGVGATEQFPGVFYIAAKGTVEYGYRSGYFHEYWVHCDKWRNKVQRLVFRQLTSDLKKGFVSIPEFLQRVFDVEDPINNYVLDGNEITCTLGEVILPEGVEFGFDQTISLAALPPAEEVEIRTPTMWLMIKPNDNEPYILSRRAVQKGRITPYHISALPKYVRDQIPHEFQYWNVKDSKAALKVRDSLVEAIKKFKVAIDYDKGFKPVSRASKEDDQAVLKLGVERKFVLNHRVWRGPLHVRVGASAELYDLWIDMDNFAYLFVFNNDPTSMSVVGTMQKIKDKHLMDTTGDLPPGSILNPNRQIPVTVERVVKGSMLLLIDDPHLKKFQVKTSKWKGLYLLEEDENTNIWTLRVTGNVGEAE